MRKVNADVVIVGAGLTGLCLAYYLRNSDLEVVLVEGRARLGGRIYTIQEDGNAPLEMGATWIHDHHHACLELMDELGLKVFEQEFGRAAIYETSASAQAQLVSLPPSGNPSYRIVDGSSLIIDRLSSNINDEKIFLGQEVLSIEEKGASIFANTQSISFEGKLLVSTLPPYLFENKISVNPSLPENLKRVMSRTRTWMGNSIKVALSYKDPFWKTNDISGTIFSKVGPIFEMYDHTDFHNNKFAIKGFINGAYKDLSKKERCDIVLSQLEKFYGPKVHDYVSYEDLDWSKEEYTAVTMQELLEPRSNFGHAVYQDAYLNGKLIFAGTETSSKEGGFMEGAVLSAKKVLGAVSNLQ